MLTCKHCMTKLDADSQFCKYCGKSVEIVPPTVILPEPYNNSYGRWRVTTEGDVEGKTTKDLGCFEGYIDEIAQVLASNAYYGLCFKAVPSLEQLAETAPPCKSVSISLDIGSKTWGLNNKARVASMANVLKDRPVRVIPSDLHASVQLRFEDNVDER